MRRVRFRAPMFGVIILLGMAGCHDPSKPSPNDLSQLQSNPFWDRFNHPFDDNKLKTVQDASSRFDEFTGGESGFSGQLENNLKTTTQLAATANAVRADLDDKLRAYLSTDITWRGLRRQVYVDLGIPVVQVGGAVLDPEFEASERVQIRQLKLAAVIRAMALLGEAQAAVLKRAVTESDQAQKDLADMQKQVDEAAKKGPVSQFPKLPAQLPPNAPTKPDLTGMTPEQQKQALNKWQTDIEKAKNDLDKARCARVQWVIQLFTAFEQAGANFKQNQALLDRATALQKKLLATINDSADPASSKALVAVLGTGLGDADFALLDDYLEKLNEALNKFPRPDQAAPPTTQPTTKTASATQNDESNPQTQTTEEQAWDLLTPSFMETKLLLYIAQRAGNVRSNLIQNREPHDALKQINQTRARTTMKLTADGAIFRPGSEGKIDEVPASEYLQRYNDAKRNVRDFDPYQIRKEKAWIARTAATQPAARPSSQEIPPGAAPDKGAAPPSGLPDPPRSRIGTSRQTNGNGRVNAFFIPPTQPATPTQPGEATPPGATIPPATAPALVPHDPRTRRFFTTIKGLQQTPTPPALSNTKANSLTQMLELTSEVETLLDKLNLHSGADALKLATDRADIAIDTLDKLSQNLAEIQKGEGAGFVALMATALQAQANLTTPGSCDIKAPSQGNETTALGLFQLILRANPKLTLQFGKLLGGADKQAYTDLLNQIGSAVNDGNNLVLSARLRIQQYIGDLTKVQSDVAQENARHTQTMLTLAKLEAARWALTGELLDQYGVIYDPQIWLRNPNLPLGVQSPPDPRDADTREDWTLANPDEPDRHHPMIETWRIRLFADQFTPYTGERDTFAKSNSEFQSAQSNAITSTEVLKKGSDAYKNVTGDTNLIKQHPFISRDDSVVASIRKLADTVRVFHFSDQQANDPLGWNLTRANIRLQNAVSLIDGTMLLLSGNEHAARDDANRLQSELSLHSLRLDSFERRTFEAGFRLTLGDVKAFHSTGFTDKDLQILQAAALTAIGIRVGH